MAKKKKTSKPKTPKLKKQGHTLIKDVTFSDGTKKKGERVYLTEEGRKYFKSQNFIE